MISSTSSSVNCSPEETSGKFLKSLKHQEHRGNDHLPMWVIKYRNSLKRFVVKNEFVDDKTAETIASHWAVINPFPSRSNTLKASLIISLSLSLFIRFILSQRQIMQIRRHFIVAMRPFTIWQNSGNSIVPLPSMSTSLIMSRSS